MSEDPFEARKHLEIGSFLCCITKKFFYKSFSIQPEESKPSFRLGSFAENNYLVPENTIRRVIRR